VGDAYGGVGAVDQDPFVVGGEFDAHVVLRKVNVETLKKCNLNCLCFYPQRALGI
jgi:hypothetical protein